MEAIRRLLPAREGGGLLSTRRGTTAVAVGAALLAGLLLLVFLNRYKHSVRGSTSPATVLVARSVIQKGSSGDVIAAKGLFESTRMTESQLKNGALTDSSALHGRVAATDIYPGQQLTAADFTTVSQNDIQAKLADNERAISVPLDSSHGLIGQVQTGDHVDVLAGFNQTGTGGSGRPVVRTLLQNVLVLKAASAGGGIAAANRTSSVLLRVTDNQAADVAFAADNGKVWIVLRPAAGAQQDRPSMVTLESLLTGVKAIPSGGGQ